MYLRYPSRRYHGYYTNYAKIERERIEAMESECLKHERALNRGKAFVHLYAASRELVNEYPDRYPYLQYWVDQIRQLNLAPKVKEDA